MGNSAQTQGTQVADAAAQVRLLVNDTARKIDVAGFIATLVTLEGDMINNDANDDQIRA